MVHSFFAAPTFLIVSDLSSDRDMMVDSAKGGGNGGACCEGDGRCCSGWAELVLLVLGVVLPLFETTDGASTALVDDYTVDVLVMK